jgi:hypothetical protein
MTIVAKIILSPIQCDQIGRIFAQWVIVCLGQFIENDKILK